MSELTQYAEAALLRSPELRWALLFAPAPRRSHAQAALALLYELFETCYGLRDERVAFSKLQWWEQELTQSQIALAQHPLTRALVDAQLADLEAGVRAVQLLGVEMAAPSPASFTQQLAEAGAWASGFAGLYLGKQAKPHQLAAVSNLFGKLGMLRKLQLSGRPGRYGPVAVPLALLAKHELRAQALGAPEAQPVIAEQATQLAEALSLTGTLGIHELRALAGNARLSAQAMAAAGGSREMPKVNLLRRLYVGWQGARTEAG